ncbi:MAG: SMP-30/gluconolactonase/LRE family protein [Ferruginibacter sp.]
MKHTRPGQSHQRDKIPFLLLLLFSLNCFGQQTAKRLAKDDKPTLVSNQFKFTEGPAADRQGNIFFTDQPNNKIWKYDIEGKLSVFLDSAGRSNGMYFDDQGNLVTCADENNQLWMISPTGKVTILLDDFMGHRFNGPNDLWIDHNGGIYFTDPYFQRDYWQRKSPDPEINGEKLYYLAKGKTEAFIVDDSLKKPNGIIGQAGKYLFVSDMGVGKIFRYELGNDGKLTIRSAFASDLADGMTLDNAGNLYLAGKGVTVYDSTGLKIQQYAIPSGWTANLCFGGVNNDLLFITASESVYILRMNVKGMKQGKL